MANQEDLDKLVANARETLTQELKDWISPNEPYGASKIVKGLFALRNYGGGEMLIGFEDGTGSPNPVPKGFNPRAEFDQDNIDRLVTRHASKFFPVDVGFGRISGAEYPVLSVPGDVVTPVVVKKPLHASPGGKELLAMNDVYVRSTSSNHTPSSTRARHEDWEGIMERCFNNREADIGAFLRRQLPPDSMAMFIEALRAAVDDPKLSSFLNPAERHELGGALGGWQIEDNAQAKAKAFLDVCTTHAEEKISKAKEVPEHGFWEVSAFIEGETEQKHTATEPFLELMNRSNPRYTGWPFWVTLHNEEDRPKHYKAGYEALIVSRPSEYGGHVDFWRAEPGDALFYNRRAYQDDMGSGRAPKPRTQLDFGLAILRAAEAMLVPHAFARAMGFPTDATSIGYAFRWTDLEGRVLSSWANPARLLSVDRTSYQEEAFATATVPLGAPATAFAPYVAQIIAPLFAAFDGFEISPAVVEDLVTRLATRKL